MPVNYSSNRRQAGVQGATNSAPKYAAPAVVPGGLADLVKLFKTVTKLEAAVFFQAEKATSAKVTVYGTTATGHNLQVVAGSAAGGAPRLPVDELKSVIVAAKLVSVWETERDGRLVTHESEGTGEQYRMLTCTPTAVAGL